jgi:hypothetical protein
MTMERKLIECYGKKKCPKGPNNSNRILCSLFYPCLGVFILGRLVKHKNLRKLMCEVREIWPTSPDYLILHHIGTVATANGIRYGRNAVDSAIEYSEIHLDVEPRIEASEIRRAFGVHGREGKARRINPLKEGTGEADPSPNSSFLDGGMEHLTTPSSAPHSEVLADNYTGGSTL